MRVQCVSQTKRCNANLGIPLSLPLSIALSVSCWSASASANDNQLGWSVTSRGETNSNAALTENEPVRVTGAYISPQLDFSSATERSRWTLETGIDFGKFNEDSYDKENYRGQFGYLRQQERGSYRFSLNYADEQIRNTDIEAERLENPEENRRETGTAQFSWQFFASEKNLLLYQLQAQGSRYESDRYSDYGYGTSSLGWNYSVSDVLTTTTRIQFSRYESSYETLLPIAPYNFSNAPSDIETITTDRGYFIGFQWQFAEMWDWSLSAGNSTIENLQTAQLPRYSFDTNAPLVVYGEGEYESQSRSKRVESELTHSGERHSWSLGINIGTKGSSRGVLVNTNAMTLSARYSLFENTQIVGRIKAEREESVDEELVSSEAEGIKDYFYSTVGINHRFSPHWTGNASLQYVTQRREPLDATPEAVIWSLGIAYYPAALNW